MSPCRASPGTPASAQPPVPVPASRATRCGVCTPEWRRGLAGCRRRRGPSGEKTRPVLRGVAASPALSLTLRPPGAPRNPADRRRRRILAPVPDIPAQLAAALADRYAIERELG